MARVYALALSIVVIILALGCEMAADQKLYLATDALRQGQLDRAIELSTQLLHAGNIQPQDRVRFLVGAHTIRGAAYRDQGDFTRALQDFDQAIKLNPKWAGIYVERSLLYEKQGLWAKALADLQKADQLDPQGAGERLVRLRRLKAKVAGGS